MLQHMKYRKLRIAFSAVCGIICLLLIVFWMRSYGRAEWAGGWLTSNSGASVSSCLGSVQLCYSAPPRPATGRELDEENWGSQLITDWELENEYIQPPSGSGEFHRGGSETSLRVFVPHWFLVLITFMSAVAPWIHWSKSFSLRTLLFSTTLIAVVLGLIVAVSS